MALENGKSRMDLSTAKTNGPAQAAYEALGWVRDEVFYTYSKHVRQGDFFSAGGGSVLHATPMSY